MDKTEQKMESSPVFSENITNFPKKTNEKQQNQSNRKANKENDSYQISIFQSYN